MRSKTGLAGAALMSAALTVGSAHAGSYTLQTTIPIPTSAANVQPGGAFTSFDISFFDPWTENYFVSDRSNGGVDIISGSSLKYLGLAAGFAGQQATTSVSGPDGVLAVTSRKGTTLFAGDGDSTLKIFNATDPTAPSLLQSISTGGSFRVDEMAYSPLTHQVLAANNADSPAFATIFNTAASPVAITHSDIVIPGAAPTDGLEQSVWDPYTQSFFVSVPAFSGDQGGVAEILTDGTVGRLYKFALLTGGPTACSPAGLAVGRSGHLMVGCGTAKTQAVLLDPTGSGSIVKTFPEISGTDELWYDPASENFFVTGADTSGNRVFAVISDRSKKVTQSVALPVAPTSNPHSIAVNPYNGDVFVPLPGNTATVGGNTACPLGCIAVYSQPKPKPHMFSGVPGQADCYRKTTGALAKNYGEIIDAAMDLRFFDADGLQDAIQKFCAGAPDGDE